MDYRVSNHKLFVLYDIRHLIESMGEDRKIPVFYDLQRSPRYENCLESMKYAITVITQGGRGIPTASSQFRKAQARALGDCRQIVTAAGFPSFATAFAARSFTGPRSMTL